MIHVDSASILFRKLDFETRLDFSILRSPKCVNPILIELIVLNYLLGDSVLFFFSAVDRLNFL